MTEELISKTVQALKVNNFDCFVAKDLDNAKDIFINEILPTMKFTKVSYGDSITMLSTGVLDHLRAMPDIDFIDTFCEEDSWRTIIQKRKEALTADLFLTGTNAITEKGQLVNLDMIGNRVAALTFGPRNIVIFVGTNKIVADIDSAFTRIRTIAAPQNAIRHPLLKTPCQKSGKCHDCKSPDRICNTWNITEKSYPKGRIKIILIEGDYGY